MPALRQSLKRPRFWITLVLAGALALAAAVDWWRVPSRQVSVRLYDQGVQSVYRGFVKRATSRFIRCRFIPSCSQYSVSAVHTYGFPKGLWLTFKRICRCGPWVRPGTYDPLPAPRVS